jgi:hypothetical protein
MIAGIVLMALGFQTVLEYVGDASDHTLREPLELLPLCAFYLGAALYLLAHVAFTHRATHIVKVQRIVAAVVIVLLVPVAVDIPALTALGSLAAVLVALIALESVWFADARERIRHENDVVPSSEPIALDPARDDQEDLGRF